MEHDVVTRCKFIVDQVVIGRRWNGKTNTAGATSLKMSAVMPTSDGAEGFKHDENHAFWNATPSGTLEVQIQNGAAAELFQPGDEFYLDFVRVPKAEPVAA